MKPTEEFLPDQYLVTHFVNPGQTGLRLDSFLKERYRKRSREQIKRFIDAGSVIIQRTQGPHVSIGRLKPSTQLIGGDEVLVVSERKPEPEVCFDYRILHEDDALLVIDKPANLPVHPAGRYFFNTLLIHLRTHGHTNNKLKAEPEYFLPHRIDKETSGVLVLAKNKEVCATVVRQFAERTTSKRYLALVKGAPPREFSVDAPLKKSTNSIIELKMTTAPVEDGGQVSLTDFRTLETRGSYSLVECFPKTGRQHQIRVHLEIAGHPIVGDKLYGMPEEEALRFYERKHQTPEALARLILPRHALHAAGIEIEHPITKLPIEFRSELPQDLRAWFDAQ